MGEKFLSIIICKLICVLLNYHTISCINSFSIEFAISWSLFNEGPSKVTRAKASVPLYLKRILPDVPNSFSNFFTRVVVLGKDGNYKAEYLSDKIGEATDLAVSEKEGKIILLAGAKIYSLTIKHI